MNNIYIFKGDSTTFADVTKFLTFHIQTNLNLAQWKAEFSLGSVIKTVEDISSKSFEIILSKEDTEGLLYGLKYGALKLIDDKGQIKTVANKLPFMITNEVIENTHEVIDLAIPKSTAIDINVEVGQKGGGGGGTTDYANLDNKPQINGVELVGNKTYDDLNLQRKGNYATREQLNSTDDEVNFLTGEVSDVKQSLLNKLEVGNIIQGDNITLNKVGNNITINGKDFATKQYVDAKIIGALEASY